MYERGSSSETSTGQITTRAPCASSIATFSFGIFDGAVQTSL